MTLEDLLRMEVKGKRVTDLTISGFKIVVKKETEFGVIITVYAAETEFQFLDFQVSGNRLTPINEEGAVA